MRVVLGFLTSAMCCLPSLVSRQLDLKRRWWLYGCCILLGGAILWSDIPGSAAIYAVLLGACIVLSFFRSEKPGKYLRIALCWGSGMATLCGRFLFSAQAVFLSAVSVLIVSTGFSFASRWLSKWTAEDFVALTEEKKTSPMLLMCFLLGVLFVITAVSEVFSVACAWLAVAFGIAIALTITLWNDLSLAVSHSLETSQQRQSRMAAIDRASRDSDAEIFRQLTECRNHITQLQLAYGNHDMAAVDALLSTETDSRRRSYTDNMLLDAVLRNRAYQIEKRGMRTDFILQIDSIRGYSISDIGVILETMLDLISDSFGGSHDLVKLRVQTWHRMIIMTAGRRSGIQSIPELKRETLRQLADDYHGWFEIAEFGKETRISVVLLDPVRRETSEA